MPVMLPWSSRLILALVLGLASLAAGCGSAPYTGRRQLLLTSEGSETSMGLKAFQQLKRRYPVSRDPALNYLVQGVGQRIARAANRPDYRWEFVVFKDDKEANAFCLPGGKVGIFTGILKYTRDENGLATVIAHEAGHAIARHSGERMSQSMLAQAGGLGLGLALGGAGGAAGQAAMTGYSLGAQLGILLPYSRSQEYEADRIGLILMAKAGFDPATAISFWKRMMAGEPGSKVPQFLSTHPKDADRIRAMEAFLPQARRYYVAAAPEPQPRWGPQRRPAPETRPRDGLELRPLTANRAAAPASPPETAAPPCGRWVPVTQPK